MLWQRYYECYIRTETPEVEGEPYQDHVATQPVDAVITPSGEIYLLTNSRLRNANLGDQFAHGYTTFVLKLSAAGEPLWGREIPVGAPKALQLVDGELRALLHQDYLRLTLDGEIIERRQYETAGDPHASFLQGVHYLTADGQTCMTGYYNGNVLAIGIDGDGEVAWSNAYDAEALNGLPETRSFPEGTDGSVLLAGSTPHHGNEPTSAYLMSLRPDGSVRFARTWESESYVSGLAQDRDGRILVTGGENYWRPSARKFLLYTFSPAGDPLRGMELLGADDSAALDLLCQQDGSLLIAGAAPAAHVQTNVFEPGTVTVTPEPVDTEVVIIDDEELMDNDDMLMFASDFIADHGGGGRDGLIMKLTQY